MILKLYQIALAYSYLVERNALVTKGGSREIYRAQHLD